MNNLYNLSDKIKIQKYNFIRKKEEIFCSSTWNEEVIVNSDVFIKTQSAISGLALRKEVNGRMICKIIDGICDEEDIDFADFGNSYIELPQIFSTLEQLEQSEKINIFRQEPFSYEKFNIEIVDFDYKNLFQEMKARFKMIDVDLIEMNAYYQYILFRYMNSDGKNGYGYRNIISISIAYNKNNKMETYSLYETGTSIYSALKMALKITFEKAKNDIDILKKIVTIPSDIEGILIPSNLLAKLIDSFYLTYYLKDKKLKGDNIPHISDLLSIVVNDFENKTVGGDIDGIGMNLTPMFLCKEGRSFDFYDVIKRYDYRENPNFRLDKMRVLPGEKSISDFYERHIVKICELRGIEESFDPKTLDFVAFIKGKEYNNNIAINQVEVEKKLNVVRILQSIIAVGNICKYELDGRMLVPDVIVNSKWLC